MKVLCDKAYLTPISRSVSAALADPLGVISSAVLLLSAVLLGALDFSCGILVLPLIIFDLVAVSVSIYAARRQNGKFGLPVLKFSAFFAFFVSAIVFSLITATSYLGLFEFDMRLYNISFSEMPLPLNLLNSGFLSFEMYTLPLALLFLAKGVSACSLHGCVRKNLPMRGGLIVSLILMLLSLAAFVQDGLERARIIPSTYTYCGPELQNRMTMYTTAAVAALAAVAVVLQIIKTFITYFKLRK